MAINCGLITSGYTRQCENISAGIVSFRIANYSAVTTWSAATDGSIVSGGANPPNFYLIEQRQGVAAYVEDGVYNAQYGNKSMIPKVTITLIGQSQANRNLLNELNAGIYVVIVELEEGRYVLLGRTKGLEASAASINPGIAAGDPDIMTIELSGRAAEAAPTINATYVDTLTV